MAMRRSSTSTRACEWGMLNMTVRNRLTLALATCSTLALATSAFAQGAPAGSSAGNEVVVTAERREERVVEVPISITVANQAQLERQQVNSINDLNRIAPSLEIQSAPGQNTGGGGSIRGIGTQTFNAGAVGSVGIVVDQVSQGNANIADLFDVSRVEVLKGPQGTLFGLTTSAGVINITTNAPQPGVFSGRVRTELTSAGTAGSDYGQQVIQGVVNIPVSMNSALRVSGLANLRQGVDRNLTTGDLNSNDHYSVRARYMWKPSDVFTLNLIGDYAHGTSTGDGDFFTFVKAGGPGILPLPTPFPIPDPGVANQLASCGVIARPGNQDFCTAQDLRDTNNNYGASLQLDYSAGPFTVTSISAYRKSDDSTTGQNIFRADPLQLQITGGPAVSNVELFSQEIRLSSPSSGRLEYTIGGFYSHQRSNQEPSFFDINLTPFPGLTIPITAQPGARNVITDESVAAFGQATFHVTDAFRLIAGGRFTHGSLTLNRLDLAVGTPTSNVLKTDKVSYRFGAQYDLAANTMAYVTVSRGYKGGQIAVPALPQLPFIVRPEIPMDYEVGLKSNLFGGWIMDLNAFYEKVQDFQAQQCTVNPLTAALSCVQTNIDGVVSKGVELNFFGRVFEGMTLNTGFIVADASYPSHFLGADGTDIGGTQLAYAPKYKFTLSGEYEHSISSAFNGFLGVDAVWKSRIRYEANSLLDTTMPAHWMVGGRIGVRDSMDRYSASIYARNLFDQHEPSLFQSGFPYGGAANIGAIYGPQSFRQVGISLEGRF